VLVDSHAHLDDPRFDSDRPKVVLNAVEEGVHRILTVGTDVATSRRAIDIAREFANVSCAVGIHPLRADTLAEGEDDIRSIAADAEVRAIGEIGLDYYRDTVDRDTQIRAMMAQLELAAELDLPVIIHDRDAHEDTLNLLKTCDVRGVMHCFSGDLAMAESAISHGFYISLAGNVTYKSAADLRAVARDVPLERLLLETDSPYLTPQPWRGSRNEPSHVTAVAGTVAGLRGLTVEEVATRTAENAVRLFGWN
jgi:TatD DNase family protein